MSKRQLRALRFLALIAVIFALSSCHGTVFLRTYQKGNVNGFRIYRYNSRPQLFSMWENATSDFLWVVKSPFPELPNIKKLSYGSIPRGLVQVYPKGEGHPKSLVPGQVVVVCIEYQYDYFIAPSMGNKYWLFRVLNDGSLAEIDNSQDKINYKKFLEPEN